MMTSLIGINQTLLNITSRPPHVILWTIAFPSDKVLGSAIHIIHIFATPLHYARVMFTMLMAPGTGCWLRSICTTDLELPETSIQTSLTSCVQPTDTNPASACL